MSDTPRVDAAEIRHGKEGYSYLTVSVEFARQLERELCRQHADNERLRQINWSHEMKLSVRGYEMQIDSLKADNEQLREALAWAYNLRHLRGHSDPVVIPERFAPFIEAALRQEDKA